MCSPSEEGDPLSPSRWTEVQWDNDAQGQPMHADMAPLPVVGGVDMGEPLQKAVCWHVSPPRVCALCPGPSPVWLFGECVVTSRGCIGRNFPFPPSGGKHQ